MNELEEAKEKSLLLLKKKKNLKKREKNRLKFIEKLKSEGKYNDNMKLDEDRWKPKYLRISYQKSRKGMKMSNKGSSQGVNQNKNESDKFDMKKKVDERKSIETSKSNNNNSKSSSSTTSSTTTTTTTNCKPINQNIRKRQGKKKRH